MTQEILLIHLHICWNFRLLALGRRHQFMLAMALKLCSSSMMGNLTARSCRVPRAPQRALVVMAAGKEQTISQSDFAKKFAEKHDFDEKTAKKAVKGVRTSLSAQLSWIDFIFPIQPFHSFNR